MKSFEVNFEKKVTSSNIQVSNRPSDDILDRQMISVVMQMVDRYMIAL